MTVTLQWISHASFKITAEVTVYIDPWKLVRVDHDAGLILISHSHYDHLSAEDIAKAAGDHTEIAASADVIAELGKGHALAPGETIELAGVKVSAVPAYNPNKEFHPRANKWLGLVVEIQGKRIYYAGDTDQVPEMADLKNIDLALLPVGGTYTMTAVEAAKALKLFNPARAVPYHWGDIIGDRRDAEQFKKKAPCPVTILDPGQSLTL